MSLEVLKNENSLGVSLLQAVGDLTSGACFAWEFDTVFEHLKKEYNIELQVAPADRLMACLAAKANPSFLWDMPVFQSMVQTLNGEEAITDSIVQCSVGECAWAVTELKKLGDLYGMDFSGDMYNDGPSTYMAGCAAADGFLCMPEELSFCDDEFDRMFPISKRASKEAVKKLRLRAKKESPVQGEEDDPLFIGTRKLQEVTLYVTSRKKQLPS